VFLLEGRQYFLETLDNTNDLLEAINSGQQVSNLLLAETEQKKKNVKCPPPLRWCFKRVQEFFYETKRKITLLYSF